MTQRPQQPELMDEFGVRFHGRAETVTGDVWWYEQDGNRYPLLPAQARTDGETMRDTEYEDDKAVDARWNFESREP
jgi:hypothetical protein